MNSPYKIIKTTTTEIGRFKIHMDELQRNGKNCPYSYTEVAEGVHVLVLVDNQVCILKQYRYPIDAWMYEFCGGSIEEGDTSEQAAYKEVREETGYEPYKLQNLGCIYTSYGYTNEKVHLYVAYCSSNNLQRTQLEPLEVIETKLCSKNEIDEMIERGEIVDCQVDLTHFFIQI